MRRDEHVVKVGRGIGGDHQRALAGVGERDRAGGRGLPDAAVAGEEQVARALSAHWSAGSASTAGRLMSASVGAAAEAA